MTVNYFTSSLAYNVIDLSFHQTVKPVIASLIPKVNHSYSTKLSKLFKTATSSDVIEDSDDSEEYGEIINKAYDICLGEVLAFCKTDVFK